MRKVNGKKLGIGVLCALLLAGAFLTGHYAGAASKTPGGAEDPLITLGYLEKRLAEASGSYEKVQLNKGEKLLCLKNSGAQIFGQGKESVLHIKEECFIIIRNLRSGLENTFQFLILRAESTICLELLKCHTAGF